MKQLNLALLSAVLKNPTWDVLLILFFLGSGFILGTMGSGRSRLLSFLFANYVALFISPLLFGYLDFVKIGIPRTWRNVVLYLLMLVLFFLLFQRNIFGGAGRAPYTWWQALLMSFLAVGFFVAGSLNMLSFRGIVSFSTLTNALFAGKRAYLFWSLAPLGGLVVAARGRYH